MTRKCRTERNEGRSAANVKAGKRTDLFTEKDTDTDMDADTNANAKTKINNTNTNYKLLITSY